MEVAVPSDRGLALLGTRCHEMDPSAMVQARLSHDRWGHTSSSTVLGTAAVGDDPWVCSELDDAPLIANKVRIIPMFPGKIRLIG